MRMNRLLVIVLVLVAIAVPAALPTYAQTPVAYRWHTMTSSTAATNQTVAAGFLDGAMNNINVGPLQGARVWQAAGIVWNSDVRLDSFGFTNGYDPAGDGNLEANLTIQFSPDGLIWQDLSGWTWNPVYPYADTVAGVTYTASGPAVVVRGIRAVGEVRTAVNSSYQWIVQELYYAYAPPPTATPTPTATMIATPTPNTIPMVCTGPYTATGTPATTTLSSPAYIRLDWLSLSTTRLNVQGENLTTIGQISSLWDSTINITAISGTAQYSICTPFVMPTALPTLLPDQTLGLALPIQGTAITEVGTQPRGIGLITVFLMSLGMMLLVRVIRG